MTALTVPAADSDRPQPVAPYWHTGILVAICAAMALGGAFWQHAGAPGSASHHSPVPLYLSLLAAEWGLLNFVRRGSRRSGTTLAELIGRDALRVRGLPQDCLLGLLCCGAIKGVEISRLYLFDHDHVTYIHILVPRHPLETALWIALSVSAGICEEVVFRGYLQRQLSAFTHSRWLGLLLQAALFGIGHTYEGAGACLRIMFFAVLLGVLANWRKQLRPGMIAHATANILSGVFGV